MYFYASQGFFGHTKIETKQRWCFLLCITTFMVFSATLNNVTYPIMRVCVGYINDQQLDH